MARCILLCTKIWISGSNQENINHYSYSVCVDPVRGLREPGGGEPGRNLPDPGYIPPTTGTL